MSSLAWHLPQVFDKKQDSFYNIPGFVAAWFAKIIPAICVWLKKYIPSMGNVTYWE